MPSDLKLAELEARIARLEQAAGLTDKASMTLALFGTNWPDGRPRKQRYPNCWHDIPVRTAVIRLHRSMTITQAVARLRAEFGADRAPSRSSLQRIWQKLDQVANLQLDSMVAGGVRDGLAAYEGSNSRG